MHMQDQEDAMSSTITIGYSDEDIEVSFDENSSMPEISEESETTDSGKEYPVKMVRAKSTTKDETDAKPKFKKATSLNASSIARLEQYYDGEDKSSLPGSTRPAKQNPLCLNMTSYMNHAKKYQ